MSLPDTVFIFVLALIIFGPKKLPEIGRQLGRLVGEFRRASNEFKFQIEEELRQVELTDRQTISAPKSEPAAAIESSSLTASESLAESEPLYESDAATHPDLLDQEETLPVGQYPNIDNLDPNDLDQSNREIDEQEFAGDSNGVEVSADTPDDSPTIRAAAGAQPRTNDPYTNAESATPTPAENKPAAAAPEATPDSPVASVPSATDATPMPQAEPNSYAASTVADVTHG